MKEDLGRIALAGLLHDIGKFAYHAGEQVNGRKDHALLGDKFVRLYVPAAWRGALAPVGWHHGDPEGKGHETFPVQVVQVADRLSAGEREKREEENIAIVPQMVTPFSSLGPYQTSPAWLPLASLALDESLFPKPDHLGKSELEQVYKELWKNFCEKADKLRQVHELNPVLETYLASMLDLLLRYTWCVPSAFYHDVPDVSLYDHSRITAAVAVCVYASFVGQESELRQILTSLRGQDPLEWPEEPNVAALVEGDLSGIQDFIYGLKNPKGSASVLRARSFYLQILTEVIARWMLRQMELPPTNLLYCGGGRFRLLVPITELNRLEDFRAHVNRVLLRAHRGALYLALEGIPLTPAHFGRAPVHMEKGRWQAPRGLRAAEDDLAQKLSERKRRRFLELPAADLTDLFRPSGGEEGICDVCGEPGVIEEDEEGIRWCRSCQSFRELGRALRNAKFVRLIWQEASSFSRLSTWKDVLHSFGFKMDIGSELWPPAQEISLLWYLTDDPIPPRVPQEIAARKFLVNVVATWKEGEKPPDPELAGKVGEVKHFGVLAANSRGARAIGVLRMDMDNLGWLLRDGFVVQKDGKYFDYGTFSRKHSLSTFLTLFFEGFVDKFVRDLAKEEDCARVYAVYSGGDDLFFVGSWDAMPILAHRIRQKFAEFSGRKDLGISAGIIIVHEKYPLYLAAQKAATALERAKTPRDNRVQKGLPPQKDAISFLGRVVPWENFAEVWELVKNLKEEVEKNEQATRRLLFVLQEVEEEYRRGKTKRGVWGPWIWRTAYWLARHQEMARKAARDTSLYANLKKKLSGEAFGENIELISLAARWAELLTRKRGGI